MAGETERMEGSPEEDSGDVVGGRSEPLSVLVSAYAQSNFLSVAEPRSQERR